MKNILIAAVFLLGGAVYAGTEELSLGVTTDVYFEPDLDISVQGVTFLDYKYFFNDNLGVGSSVDLITTYADALDRKFVQLPFLFSFTARVGTEKFFVPFVTKIGPVLSITTGDVSAGFKVSFQTGVQYFVTDNVGLQFLAGPFYSYISGNMFGIKMDSGIILRL